MSDSSRLEEITHLCLADDQISLQNEKKKILKSSRHFLFLSKRKLKNFDARPMTSLTEMKFFAIESCSQMHF